MRVTDEQSLNNLIKRTYIESALMFSFNLTTQFLSKNLAKYLSDFQIRIYWKRDINETFKFLK